MARGGGGRLTIAMIHPGLKEQSWKYNDRRKRNVVLKKLTKKGGAKKNNEVRTNLKPPF